MIVRRSRGTWVIATTFVAALLLTVLPLPDWALRLQPEWMMLVLIYWCLALPERIGVGTGWSMGLILDVVHDTVLGQYALSLTIVAFLALYLHRRLRLLPVWQQTLSIFLLVFIGQVLVLWVKGLTGNLVWNISYLLPPLISAVLWPAVFAILRGLRRRYAPRA
jgi:rod shape-determining protein MreD